VREGLTTLKVPRTSLHEGFAELLPPPPPDNREMDPHMLSHVLERLFHVKHSHGGDSCSVKFGPLEATPLAALGCLFTGT
jgi:hypothetical protein